MPYNAIHSPMQAKLNYMLRFGNIGDEHRRVFAAMLSSLDDGVGLLLGKLREKKLEEDTLIFRAVGWPQFLADWNTGLNYHRMFY